MIIFSYNLVGWRFFAYYLESKQKEKTVSRLCYHGSNGQLRLPRWTNRQNCAQHGHSGAGLVRARLFMVVKYVEGEPAWARAPAADVLNRLWLPSHATSAGTSSRMRQCQRNPDSFVNDPVCRIKLAQKPWNRPKNGEKVMTG